MIDAYNHKGIKWLLLILLSSIWGSSYILVKKGLQVFSPVEVATLRIFAGGLFLLPVSLPRLNKLTYRHYKLLLLSGLMGSFVPAFLVAKAQMKIPSAINGVFNSLTPSCVLLVGILVFQQKISRSELLGAGLGILGSILLVCCESANQANGLNLYAIFPVLVSFLYGSSINFTKFYLQELSAQTIASVSLLLVGSIAGILLFTQTNFWAKLGTVAGSYQAMTYILVLGMVNLGFAHILFASLIKLASPVFASTISFYIPIIAVTWGLLDQEVLTWQQYIGILVIFLGVYFINQYSTTKKNYIKQ